jgi:hypothetical protein
MIADSINAQLAQHPGTLMLFSAVEQLPQAQQKFRTARGSVLHIERSCVAPDFVLAISRVCCKWAVA